MSIPRRAEQRGLTMVEMIIFIVIVSVSIAGILIVMNITSRHSGDAQLRKQALSIAEGILEEVEMAHFTYCDPQDPSAATANSVSLCTTFPEVVGPEKNNTRPFDNVNDYINNVAVPGATLGTKVPFTVTDVNNNSIVSLAGAYSAYLTISKASLQGLEPDTNASPTIGSVLQITVEVDFAGGSVVLDGYRTQYAPNFMPTQ